MAAALAAAEGRAPCTGANAVTRGGARRGGRPGRLGRRPVARRDVPTSYHVSVVVDDALQGVTDVVRGRDLFHATGLHRLLQTLLGLPAPCYHHHRLVLDAAGHKLSKSRGAPSLRDLRREGHAPADVRRLVGLGP